MASKECRNKFGLGEACMDRAFTLEIIEETHHSYQKLMKGETRAHGLMLE